MRTFPPQKTPVNCGIILAQVARAPRGLQLTRHARRCYGRYHTGHMAPYASQIRLGARGRIGSTSEAHNIQTPYRTLEAGVAGARISPNHNVYYFCHIASPWLSIPHPPICFCCSLFHLWYAATHDGAKPNPSGGSHDHTAHPSALRARTGGSTLVRAAQRLVKVAKIPIQHQHRRSRDKTSRQNPSQATQPTAKTSEKLEHC